MFSLINQIKGITSEEIVGFGSNPVFLANYGVLTNRDGSISVNATTFRKAYKADPDSFNAILNSRVTTGSSLVTGAVSGSRYTPGGYAFTISGSTATIGGDQMSLSDGKYYISSGNASGLNVELNGGGTNTTVFMAGAPREAGRLC